MSVGDKSERPSAGGPPASGSSAPGPSRRSWFLIAALIVSISINVFGLAWLVGRFDHEHRRPRGPDWGLERFADTLPKEARDLLKERFKAEKPAFRREFEAIREAREEVARQIKADPIDEAALEAALATLRERFAAVQIMAHAIIARTVAELPPEVRENWEPRWHGRKERKD